MRISSTLLSVSVWMLRSIGLERSKLKIPIMDFASIMYRPETRSNQRQIWLSHLQKTLPYQWNLMKSVLFSLEFTSFIFLLHASIVKDLSEKVNDKTVQKLWRSE